MSQPQIETLRQIVSRLEHQESVLRLSWLEESKLLDDAREALKKAEIEDALLRRLAGNKEAENSLHPKTHERN